MDQVKKCTKCKHIQSVTEFFRIIAREDYSPGCDQDNIKLFAKPTVTCATCRNQIKQKIKLKLENSKKA
jgi:hypothetical protein